MNEIIMMRTYKHTVFYKHIHFRRTVITCTLLSLLTGLLLSGCGASTNSAFPISRTGFYFDTVIGITIYALNSQNADAVSGQSASNSVEAANIILDNCMSLCSEYESLLSATKKGSDIWNINHAKGEPVVVNAETAFLTKKALYYAELSEGAFDPTLGAVSDLWNFNGDPAGPVPSATAIADVMKHVGYKKINVKSNDSTFTTADYTATYANSGLYPDAKYTIALEDPDAQLDLGGIAKGYIADQLKEKMTAAGVTSAVINLGGNVLLLGGKPEAQAEKDSGLSLFGSNRTANATDQGYTDFTIGIQKPFSDNSTYLTTVSIQDKSLVSSGVYERYFEEDGIRYHHLLDSSTGYPVENNLLGVTILSDTSADGDALSTALFCLGLERGMNLVESLGNVEAVFVTDNNELIYSSEFPQ